jgi:hypothetical protein
MSVNDPKRTFGYGTTIRGRSGNGLNRNQAKLGEKRKKYLSWMASRTRCRVIRRKLNILVLGETLSNISEAFCKLRVSRKHHYDIKSALEEEGLGGLLEKSRAENASCSYPPP